MATSESRRIDQELLGEPHVRGRRISVRQVSALVEGVSEEPEVVAERYDLDVADVYHALAYYHDHREEMEALRDERAAIVDEVRGQIDRPDGVDAA